MAESHLELTLRARRVLDLNQRTLGEALGLSSRTVQRWDAHRTVHPLYLGKVALLVHPKDPDLAVRIAHAAGTTMEALGIAPPPPPKPAPPPSPPVRSPEMTRHMVDVVVCATADALALPPAAVRPALVAALRKSLEVGLTAEDIVSVLEAPARPVAKAGGGHGTRRPT